MKRFVAQYLDTHRHNPLEILDLGSTAIGGSYRSLFDQAPWRYVGADLSG